MTHLRTVTTDTFAEDVLRSPIPSVVDFSAAWCGPCRVLAPVLDRIAGHYLGRVQFFKVDVDGEPELAARFGIRSVPTLMFVHHGRLVDRHEGLIDPRSLLLKLDHLAGAVSVTL